MEFVREKQNVYTSHNKHDWSLEDQTEFQLIMKIAAKTRHLQLTIFGVDLSNQLVTSKTCNRRHKLKICAYRQTLLPHITDINHYILHDVVNNYPMTGNDKALEKKCCIIK